MTETADRYQKVADAFSARVAAVPADAWDNPSPCDGWTARDVIVHVVEAAGMFLSRAGVGLPATPSAVDDPRGAWEAARAATQAALADPSIAQAAIDNPMGPMTLETMVGMFGVGDVLVHTWDLARATGLDERLDADEVARLHEVMAPNDEMMRQGTAFGPKVDVPDDADPQTKLLAFTGRQV